MAPDGTWIVTSSGDGTARIWNPATGSVSREALQGAFQHMGTRPGQSYCWVCSETGAELSYNPGVFGSARLIPGGIPPVRGYHWELVEPEPLSPLLPWNWLALFADRPIPDPEVVIRQVD